MWERAENIARVLHINGTYSRDKPEGPDWERVLEIYADSDLFAQHYDKPDAASVVQFYILDSNNPSSLLQSLRSARERTPVRCGT